MGVDRSVTCKAYLYGSQHLEAAQKERVTAMRFNGMFQTPNKAFVFHVETPTNGVEMISTITCASPSGKLSMKRVLYTVRDLQKAMIEIASVLGGGEDVGVHNLTKQIGVIG